MSHSTEGAAIAHEQDLPAALEGGVQGQPRDVLSDRISTWVEDDGSVYAYADRLIMDLYQAGYEVVPRAPVRCAGGFVSADQPKRGPRRADCPTCGRATAFHPITGRFAAHKRPAVVAPA